MRIAAFRMGLYVFGQDELELRPSRPTKVRGRDVVKPRLYKDSLGYSPQRGSPATAFARSRWAGVCGRTAHYEVEALCVAKVLVSS